MTFIRWCWLLTWGVGVFGGVVGLAASSAFATGVADNIHFVNPGKMAFALEPELTLTSGAGFAGNLKYTQGVSDFMNATAILGTGGGPRRFRVGGDLSFDFFPDVDKQPGIGIFTRAIYYRFPVSGELQLLGAPYIHKAFALENKNEVDPFVAVPMGIGFDNGTYRWVGNFVIGALFRSTEQFRYSMELGVNTGNSETYLAGGVIYYP